MTLSSDLGDSGDINAVFVESTWRDIEKTKDAKTQTDSTKREEVAVQTTSMTTMATQTEEADTSERKEASEEVLLEFLGLVRPLMEEQIKRNLNSHAFDDFEMAWADDGDTIVKLHTLNHDWLLSSSSTLQAHAASEGGQPAGEAGRITTCSDVSWNANGTIIAAAYGSTEHDGWCNDRAGLCFWNIMKRNIGESGKADLAIEVPCSLMCVAFHPELPTLIAGGLFNGELRVWDIANAGSDAEEPMIMSSAVDDYFHREPIAQVAWMKDVGKNSYLLVSVNGDGKVLFWSLANKLAFPVSGLALTPSAAYHGQGSSMNRYPVVGGTAVCISPLDYTNFVVGTEAGGVLRCAHVGSVRTKGLVKSGEFKWTGEAYRMIEGAEMGVRFEVKRLVENYARLNSVKAIDIPTIFAARPDPVRLFAQASRFAFEPHSGPVYALSSSPFHRNLFLSCSTDGTARLYNILRPKALLYIELAPAYLLDVAWSPSRPLVFALADSEGKVHIYDLLESMLEPILVVSVTVRVTSIAFNATDPSLLAASANNGDVAIFQLGTRLSTLQSGEQAMCDKMGAEITE